MWMHLYLIKYVVLCTHHNATTDLNVDTHIRQKGELSMHMCFNGGDIVHTC